MVLDLPAFREKVSNKKYREFVKSKFDNKCARCSINNEVSKLTIHHILKTSDGGKDNIDNLIVLCKKCHNDWHNIYEKEFGEKFWEWLKT